jgi:hypothetical protein
VRKDYLHKLSMNIVRTFKVIGIEDLNVRGMSRNRCLARRRPAILAGSGCSQQLTARLRVRELRNCWGGARQGSLGLSPTSRPSARQTKLHCNRNP